MYIYIYIYIYILYIYIYIYTYIHVCVREGMYVYIQWGEISIRTLENFYFNVYKYI